MSTTYKIAANCKTNTIDKISTITVVFLALPENQNNTEDIELSSLSPACQALTALTLECTITPKQPKMEIILDRNTRISATRAINVGRYLESLIHRLKPHLIECPFEFLAKTLKLTEQDEIWFYELDHISQQKRTTSKYGNFFNYDRSQTKMLFDEAKNLLSGQ